MEPTGRDVGPFRSVTTVRVHGGFELCTGRDEQERPVTILTMGPSAATDERLRTALADVYEWSVAHPKPEVGDFANADLTADQPWISSLDEPGKAGVRRLLDRLTRVMQTPTPGHHTGTLPKITDETPAAQAPPRERVPGPATAPPRPQPPPQPSPAAPRPSDQTTGPIPVLPTDPTGAVPVLPTGPVPTGPVPAGQPHQTGPIPRPPAAQPQTHQTGPLPQAPAQPPHTHQTGPIPQPQAVPRGRQTGSFPQVAPPQTHQTGPIPQAGPPQTHQTGPIPRPQPHQTGPIPRPQTHQTGPIPHPGPYQTGQFPRIRPDGRPQPVQPYQGPAYSAAPRPIAPASAMPSLRRPGGRTATVVLIGLIVAVAVILGCAVTGYLLFER